MESLWDRKPLGDPEEGTRPLLTRLRQPQSVRGDRDGRIGLSWMSMIGVEVQFAQR